MKVSKNKLDKLLKETVVANADGLCKVNIPCL